MKDVEEMYEGLIVMIRGPFNVHIFKHWLSRIIFKSKKHKSTMVHTIELGMMQELSHKTRCCSPVCATIWEISNKIARLLGIKHSHTHGKRIDENGMLETTKSVCGE